MIPDSPESYEDWASGNYHKRLAIMETREYGCEPCGITERITMSRADWGRAATHGRCQRCGESWWIEQDSAKAARERKEQSNG